MSTLPQKPSAVLTGPNSELFGSKLHATKTKPQPSPAGVFRYCTAKPSHLPATQRPAQAAQYPSRYQHGTPLVIVAHAARYVA